MSSIHQNEQVGSELYQHEETEGPGDNMVSSISPTPFALPRGLASEGDQDIFAYERR